MLSKLKKFFGLNKLNYGAKEVQVAPAAKPAVKKSVPTVKKAVTEKKTVDKAAAPKAAAKKPGRPKKNTEA
jgi:hypothetical protein